MITHIKNIKIKNFKCFNELNLDNLGQINLIGGKNNVGKTAFLEAIELLSNSIKPFDLLSYTHKMLKRRQIVQEKSFIELDFLSDDSICMSIESNARKCEIKYTDDISLQEEEPFGTYLVFTVDGDEKNTSADRFSSTKSFLMFTGQSKEKNKKINFIKSSKTDEKDISIFYGTLVDLNKEGFLNSSLSSFDPNLLSLKQRATEDGIVLKVQTKNKLQPILLSSLGDGINRYIAILCAIWASENGILLIDEIENGIHYSNYPKLWELIFKVSQEANCQIFVTSHSKECIDAFNQVQLKQEQPDSLYLELYRHLKTDLVTASPRRAEQLQYALTHKGDIRG